MKPNKLGEGVFFQRIRRITGYLVGTMDKWNDAKKAEEKAIEAWNRRAEDGK